MKISISKITLDLKLKTPDLITRSIGKNLYEKVQKILTNIQDGEVLLLDFDGIKVIDPSFIDECIVRLILDSKTGSPGFFIRIDNISDIAALNIASVLKSYNASHNTRLAVITGRLIDKSYYIGELESEERDIINFLVVNKGVLVRDIASYLELDAEKTVALLDSMFTMRLVRREEHEDGDYYYPV